MTGKTDILFVIGQMDIGGTEKHLRTLLPALNQRGLNVCLFAIRSGGALIKPLRDDGVEVYCPKNARRGIWGVLFAASDLIRIVRNTRPAAVHFFLPEAYLLGGFCTLFTSAKKFMSRRSLNAYQKNRWYARPLEKLLHRTLEMSFANSEPIRLQLIQEGIPENKVTVLHNGVDPFTRPENTELDKYRADLGIRSDDIVCLVVANFIPYKGHLDVIQAFSLLNTENSHDWHLIFVGRGSEANLSTIQAQIYERSLGEKVSIITNCDDPRIYLGLADIGILASHEEGFSNALLEYMAAELAIVATDVGGNSDAIDSGISGILVPPRNPETIAKSVSELIESAELRRKLASDAKRKAEEKFSLSDCIDQYFRHYVRLIEANSRQSTHNG